MNCKTCLDHVYSELDHELSPAIRQEVADHLAACPACRREHARLANLREATKSLPREIVPERDLWPEIAARIGRDTARTPAPRHTWWLPAAGLAAACLALAFWVGRQEEPVEAPGWTVTPLAGAPRVNTRALGAESTLRVGQWLVTGEEDRASLTVGTIGHVELAPRSRVRLLAAGDDANHRLELREGSLSAFIWAPPRLFFVETPSATAVDLGCAYTLSVDADGNGELHVTAGYVALEHGARSAVIPAGLRCAMRAGAGPGTPFADRAAEELRSALRRFDFGPEADGPEARAEVLASSHESDTITLWHVLRRSPGEARAAVHDRLASFAPPPAGVTRAGVIAGDATMIDLWGEALGLAVLGDVR